MYFSLIFLGIQVSICFIFNISGSYQNINVSLWQSQGQPQHHQQQQQVHACHQIPSSSHKTWNDRTGIGVKLPEIVTSAATSSFFSTLPSSHSERSNFQLPATLARPMVLPGSPHISSQRNLENFSRSTNIPALIHQLPQGQPSHFKHPAEYQQVKSIVFEKQNLRPYSHETFLHTILW